MFSPVVSVKRVTSVKNNPDVTCLCAPKQEVLKQLQGTIEEESGEASGSQLELIERLKGKRTTSEGTANSFLCALSNLDCPV